jgi:hypothetical protein
LTRKLSCLFVFRAPLPAALEFVCRSGTQKYFVQYLLQLICNPAVAAGNGFITRKLYEQKSCVFHYQLAYQMEASRYNFDAMVT